MSRNHYPLRQGSSLQHVLYDNFYFNALNILNSKACQNLSHIYYYFGIGRVDEYPKMHYFGNPRHTHSLITNKNVTECFWKF